MSQRRIAVAMSGGVDSSVAAALLSERGEDIFGLMMRLWTADQDGFNRCCSPVDVSNARRVASRLEIPFYVLDAQQIFKDNVVDAFIRGYTQGLTPNPCIECNRTIRWGFLMERALALGATHLATGHYARSIEQNGIHRLIRGRDHSKDQSYVLYMLNQHDLSRSIFPLGQLTKQEVRAHARRLELPVAERPDSQDLCFVTSHDYRAFLANQTANLPPPGQIVDLQGNIIGRHEGLASYTIGQRKGLGISSSAALYVLEKDRSTNRLVVGPRHALARLNFVTHSVSWVSPAPPTGSIGVQVQIRYKAPAIPATIEPQSSGRAFVHLSSALPDITPGQSAVFYDGEEVLGGGIIDI